MDGPTQDSEQDFVARQYANLIASGLDGAAAQQRLREVLGEAAAAWFEDGAADAGPAHHDRDGSGARLVSVARQLGGDVAHAQAELIHARTQAQLLALDWWRPIRSFLLYMLLLLALAAVISTIYLLFVLPVFGELHRTLGSGEGISGRITDHGDIRVLGPLVLMAAGVALLALHWRRMYRRMAGFESLAGRFGKRDAAASAFAVLRCLEFAAALQAAGVDDAAVMAPARELAGWPVQRPLDVAGVAVGEQLARAELLGTFAQELDWQRRLRWSAAQAQLEMSRDRLMLLSRVVFYILIGSMITAMYLPIFSVASMIGVQ